MIRVIKKTLKTPCSKDHRRMRGRTPYHLIRGFAPYLTTRGFAALFTVVAIAALVLVMVQSSYFLGIGEIETGFTSQKGHAALKSAEGCVEDTLRRIRTDQNYGVGNPPFSLSTPDGSCTIEVLANDSERTIFATSTLDAYHKTMRVQGVISASDNSIHITSWEEQESW